VSELQALWALFTSAFLAATVLPLPSEGALIAFERLYPGNSMLAVTVAAVGNTLGGMTSYCMGRFSARYLPKTGVFAPQVLNSIQRYGAASLILSWMPIVGDALCGFAGWAKLPVRKCVFWMFVGKAARYVFISALV
jgi:membrane protein YqaA with SNARE-associated domain